MDELTFLFALGFGAAFMWLLLSARRKMWYLETMDPRQHYEVGKEKKYITHMVIANHHFHGIEAGKYKVLLLYGDLSMFSKPLLSGKLEEMYISILAESLIGKKFVTKLEKFRFQDFLFKRIPSLAVKAYIITGELISPQEVLDLWKGDERDKALAEMRRRNLISSKILWIKPYPPEDKLKEIEQGKLMIPDLIRQHLEEFRRVTVSQKETLAKMDSGIAGVLEELIVLGRQIVQSISDPVQVVATIIVDKVRKIQGLGIEQLADRGSPEGVVQAAKRLKQYKEELVKALSEELKPEEIAKAQAQTQRLSEIEKRLEDLAKLVTSKAAEK